MHFASLHLLISAPLLLLFWFASCSGFSNFMAQASAGGWKKVCFVPLSCEFLLRKQFLVVFCPQPCLLSGCFSWKVSAPFSTEFFSVVVPGGCHSQGCHGYLLGLLAAPFCFTRHLHHTHQFLDGFRYILFHCIIVIQAQNKNLSTIIVLFFFYHSCDKI